MKQYLWVMAAAVLLCSCGKEEAEPVINVITAPPGCVTVTETETEITTEETEITEPPVTTKTVSFTALGDNLIHSSIYKQAARRAAAAGNDGGYDFTYAYEGAADLLDDADITILNQETLICNDIYEPDTYPCFNSPKALGEHMEKLGVDVFTIANNHTLDKGVKGLNACLDYYDENDMVRVGAYRDADDRAVIRTVERDGVVTAFLCYTESLNGLSLPEDSVLEIGRVHDKERMLEEIRAAAEISDICVVSLHWGTENSGKVEDYQREMARELGEAGADIIIGNHPHVLRELERFENSDGRETLCAYSLGNLISAQSVGTNLIGGVLNFSVTVSSDENVMPVISETEFIPVITHYDYNYADVRLYKLSDYTPELASEHGVRAYSRFDYDYIIEYLSEKGLLSEDFT